MYAVFSSLFFGAAFFLVRRFLCSFKKQNDIRSICHQREYVTSWKLDHDWLTSGSNPLKLYCDHFGCGSDHNYIKHEPVTLQQSILT